MFLHALDTPRRLRPGRRYCQNLAEFDHAMWIAAQQQIVRDDIEDVFEFQTDSIQRIATASESAIQTLASGVCSSFTISSASITNDKLKATISQPYSAFGVISTMSDGHASQRTPAGDASDISASLRDNLLARLFDISISVSQSHSVEASAIKTGLPKDVCELLQYSTMAQVRRAAWSLSDDVRFKPRFPEPILESMNRQDISRIAQKKLNFALSDGLVNS